MTQYFDFVALGWVEKYLREEMDTAMKYLHSYEREPGEVEHLQEALRNIHSVTGVLRLCARLICSGNYPSYSKHRIYILRVTSTDCTAYNRLIL